jgi:hypothetical protein
VPSAMFQATMRIFDISAPLYLKDLHLASSNRLDNFRCCK